ncbi:MAG TPA: 2OG-Fe(II) oxygenase [Gammaproteobacteria bacterium]|nr:2OG-Fe(II) oxygenase [Gammaproteobacteria bacterium]
MNFPAVPASNIVAAHFCGALQAARCNSRPYRHWILNEVLPESLAAAVLMLPIAPPVVGDCRGVRDVDNSKRTFFTPTLRARFPVCEAFASALQSPLVAQQLADTLGIITDEAYLRLEYIQDTDGAWLEPHRDIPEKLFSMVLYLCTGPEASGWGTDIYDSERRWVGRSSAEFNSAVIFVPGPDTWHGFEPRPIVGVRRLLEINYVRSDWRDRDQLAFPDQPISVQPL